MLLLRSAYSALPGQSCGYRVPVLIQRTASVLALGPRLCTRHLSGLPTLPSTSAAPTDTVPDRNTSSELDKPWPGLHCAALQPTCNRDGCK